MPGSENKSYLHRIHFSSPHRVFRGLPPPTPPDIRVTYPAVRQIKSMCRAYRLCTPTGASSPTAPTSASFQPPGLRPWSRRMQYRCSLASDFSSLSIPLRGTVQAFSVRLCGHVPARPSASRLPIRFLFIAPQLRIGLPSDPASRRRPCPSPCPRLCENLAIGLSHLRSNAPCPAHV